MAKTSETACWFAHDDLPTAYYLSQHPQEPPPELPLCSPKFPMRPAPPSRLCIAPKGYKEEILEIRSEDVEEVQTAYWLSRKSAAFARLAPRVRPKLLVVQRARWER
eukprot:g23076.t1